MPVPTELLRAAWAALPEATVRRAAEHNGIRGRAKLTVAELAERLSADGIHLASYCRQLAPDELTAVAAGFGLDVAAKNRDEIREAVWRFVVEYDSNILRAEARKLAHTLPPMTAAELIASAEPLRRRVQHLMTDPGDPIAVWRGDRFSRKHGQHPWIAVDLSQHPDDAVRRPGVLRFLVDPNKLTAATEFGPGSLPTPKTGEVALSPAAADELPEVEILLHEGPTRVREWAAVIAASGWDLVNGYNAPTFPLQNEIDAYIRTYQAGHALYSGQLDEERVYAQLGGWPFSWPDASGVEQLGRRLVLRTYRGGEPYVEVWADSDGYAVDLRII